MTCPVCSQDFEPSVTIHGLVVHPYPCDTSIVLATGQKASAVDVMHLSDDELKQIRKARNRPKRGQV